jgi:hypothetical protein
VVFNLTPDPLPESLKEELNSMQSQYPNISVHPGTILPAPQTEMLGDIPAGVDQDPSPETRSFPFLTPSRS